MAELTVLLLMMTERVFGSHLSEILVPDIMPMTASELLRLSLLQLLLLLAQAACKTMELRRSATDRRPML